MKAKLNKKRTCCGLRGASLVPLTLATSGAVASLISAFPLTALASGKEGIAFLIPDMNEFIPMLVIFLILLVVMAKLAWPIVDGIITKREDTIRQAIKESEEARAEAERTLAQYKEELRNAKAEAAQIVAEAKTAAEAQSTEIQAQAQQQANALIEKAKTTIEAEKQAAIVDIKDSIVDLTISTAGRIIGEDLSEADHRKIIERYVNEAGSLNGNQ